MDLNRFLDRLGYTQSPHFLRRGTTEFATAPDFGHVFRKAATEPDDSNDASCGLQGVYVLRHSTESRHEPIVPLVYVCKAESPEAARMVHRLVWNQDVAPFVLVHTPQGIAVYSGFSYSPNDDDLESGVLRQLVTFNAISELVDSFGADAIDSGQVWHRFGSQVNPERRVDWRLLENLRKLDWLLRKYEGLKKEVSHSLIGKYVYLHYLRHRNILSDRKLESWKIDAGTVFGRQATRAGLASVTGKLDEWLNGSVFPLSQVGQDAPSDDAIAKVAGVFSGDEIVGEWDRQLHLDFQAYDFSFIPIETLSVIYEQFLHAPEENGKTTKGKEVAAYYTPIPVVNFMLAELAARKPLSRGMKVLDPACGSGAFLVQCYRQLIEKEFPPSETPPKPSQLRELLQDHIFGIDNDPDACSVAELSLTLTLLDYVDPPDLETKGRRPHLPSLRGENIFKANLFKLGKLARAKLQRLEFDWIVGNPPWKALNPKKLIQQDKAAWGWMTSPRNSRVHPCGNHEIAQAFAWKATSLLAESGMIALLLPAKTLFAERNRIFRQAFFAAVNVVCIANLTNLRRSLWPSLSAEISRPIAPAAAVFYKLSRDPDVKESVSVFSPLSVNQPTTVGTTGSRHSWSLLLNVSEVTELPIALAASGDGLPWKLALWGSPFDSQLIRKLSRRFRNLDWFEEQGILTIAEGPALGTKQIDEGDHKTRFEKETVGKRLLNLDEFEFQRPLFVIPQSAKVQNDRHYLDLRGSVKGMEVCRPPHIIISGTGRCACYESEYLVVPRRWFGIVSRSNDERLLKALSLYLNSDFAYYALFLTSAELGIERDRIAISKLRQLPVPFSDSASSDLNPWVQLHSQIAASIPQQLATTAAKKSKGPLLFPELETNAAHPLFDKLNELVFDALDLDERERALVHDLIHVRLELNDGRLGDEAVKRPDVHFLRAYAKWLKADLDAFVSDDLAKRHQIGMVYDDLSAMVQIDLVDDKQSARHLVVAKASDASAKQLERTRERLRKERAQWVYFDRNLRLFEGTKTFIFKPMQRVHWTASQAMADASEIIAETLQSLEAEA